MLEDKQMDLIDEVMNKVKGKFPDASLGEISFGYEDTWVDILVPGSLLGDEVLDDLLAALSTDILTDYGYGILFHTMPL